MKKKNKCAEIDMFVISLILSICPWKFTAVNLSLNIDIYLLIPC
jgi:hypothetical protein